MRDGIVKIKKYITIILIVLLVVLCWATFADISMRVLERFGKIRIYNIPREYGIYLNIIQNSIFAIIISKLIKNKFRTMNRVKRGIICSIMLLLSSGNFMSIFLILLLLGYEPQAGLLNQFIIKWLFAISLAQVIVFLDDKYLTFEK